MRYRFENSKNIFLETKRGHEGENVILHSHKGRKFIFFQMFDECEVYRVVLYIPEDGKFLVLAG